MSFIRKWRQLTLWQDIYVSRSSVCRAGGQVIPCLVFASLLVCFGGCSPKPDLLWKHQTGAPIYSSPAVTGNKVVFGSNDHHLYALNKNDGKVIWKINLGDRILMSPYADGESIYVGTASGFLYQVRPHDGSIGWRYNARSMLEFDICADSEGLYFGSYNGNFHKIDRQGKILWIYQTAFQMSSACTFYKDLVLTTSWDMNIYAFTRDTGKVVWKFKTGEYNYGNGVVVGESFYFATHEDFYGFEAATGKLLFHKKTPYSNHILAHNNVLFTQENGLTKRSLDGNVVQTLQFKPFPEFRPSLAGNLIMASDTTHHLLGISPDLQLRWKFRGKNSFWVPGVFKDGVYYVGNRDTHVYALKLPS